MSISSSSSTQSLRPAFLSAWTIAPGPAATYVRRCPRISASSRTPPSEMRWNGRPSARASDCAALVLPVPGGPVNSRIGPRVGAALFAAGAGPASAANGTTASASAASRSAFSAFSLTTARYSISLLFTFSSPKWSSSSCARARSRNARSITGTAPASASAEFGHGTLTSHSRYVRSTPPSTLPACVLLSRRHSRTPVRRSSLPGAIASSFALSPASSPSSAASSSSSSLRPFELELVELEVGLEEGERAAGALSAASSRWIAAICCRRKNS